MDFSHNPGEFRSTHPRATYGVELKFIWLDFLYGEGTAQKWTRYGARKPYKILAWGFGQLKNGGVGSAYGKAEG